MAKLRFSKQNIEIDVREGDELLYLYKKNTALPLRFGCRAGECGTCTIRIEKGIENVSRPTKQERETLNNLHLSCREYRLACQCAVMGDVTLT